MARAHAARLRVLQGSETLRKISHALALVRLPDFLFHIMQRKSARRDVCQNATSKHPKGSYLQPHGESEGEEERLVKNGALINPKKKAENVLEMLDGAKAHLRYLYTFTVTIRTWSRIRRPKRT